MDATEWNVAKFNDITVEYPADYYVMSEEELNVFFAGNLARWGARNKEKHIVLAVGKTKDSILNVVVSAKGALDGAESKLRNGLRGYERTAAYDAQLLGADAKAIRFEYSAGEENVRQYCELTLVKKGRCFYASYAMCRRDDADRFADTFDRFRRALTEA